MQYSTARVEREISANGIEFDKGSVYDRLCKLTDVRKAKGKQYSLETVLMLILMAKLCGENTAMAIADWAKHRQDQLVEILHLSRPKMPHHNTYRRILAYKVYVEEIERLVGEYNQQGEHGPVYALDGKAVRGMRKKDEMGGEYLLSVYDVEQGKVMSQVEVGRKENEITKAPKALKLVEIAQKVVTGDAIHTQKGFSSQIIEARGHYVLPVKEVKDSVLNRSFLCAQFVKSITHVISVRSPKRMTKFLEHSNPSDTIYIRLRVLLSEFVKPLQQRN